MDLGKIIKQGRSKKQMTQEELAKIVKVNKVSIWAWESNKYSPSGEMLIKLGEILDIVDELFPDHKLKSEYEAKTDERLSRIEKALVEQGIVKIENNHGPVNVAGKQKIEKLVVKK